MFRFLLYLFLAIIYFFILTPFAIFMRLFGKYALDRQGSRITYWREITTDSGDEGSYKYGNILLQYKKLLQDTGQPGKWILLFILLALRVFAHQPKGKEISSDMYVMF